MRGYTAKVGLRKPVWDEPSWTQTFLPAGHGDVHGPDGWWGGVVSEFTCWTCVRGLHMGTDGTNCVCCGDPFIGPMLGRFHDEPLPDPWCPHAHVTDDTSHGGHDTLCHDCGRAGV